MIFLKWNTATRLHSIKTYFKEFSVEKLWTAFQFSKSNYFLSCLITFFWNWQLQTVQHAFNWLKAMTRFYPSRRAGRSTYSRFWVYLSHNSSSALAFLWNDYICHVLVLLTWDRWKTALCANQCMNYITMIAQQFTVYPWMSRHFACPLCGPDRGLRMEVKS